MGHRTNNRCDRNPLAVVVLTNAPLDGLDVLMARLGLAGVVDEAAAGAQARLLEVIGGALVEEPPAKS